MIPDGLFRQAVVVIEDFAAFGRVAFQPRVDGALDQRDAAERLARRDGHADAAVDERGGQGDCRRGQRPERPPCAVASRRPRQARGDEHHEEADAERPGKVANLDDFHPAILRVAEARHGHAGEQVARANSSPVQTTGAATIAGKPSRWTATRPSPMNAGK